MIRQSEKYANPKLEFSKIEKKKLLAQKAQSNYLKGLTFGEKVTEIGK